LYINKTSRRIIFLNAIIFAGMVIFIAGKLGIKTDFSAFNFAGLFLTSVTSESLRHHARKWKKRKELIECR